MNIHYNGFEAKNFLSSDVRNVFRILYFFFKVLLLFFTAKKTVSNILILELQLSFAQEVVNVFVQSVPIQLCEEREAELLRNFGDLFDLSDADLLFNGEGVEEISAEDERIRRGVDGVDPSGRDEERVPGFQVDAAAFFDQIAEKDVALLPGERPLLIDLEVCFRRRNQPKHLVIRMNVNAST